MRSRNSIVDRPRPRKARGCPMTAWCSGSARGARLGFDRGRASRDPVVARRPRRPRSICGFLHGRFPELTARVANELVERTDVLRRHPKLGRAIVDRDEYREILLKVHGGTYHPSGSRYDGSSVLMLRVFHGRAKQGRGALQATHAARRRPSICRNHLFSWFQLAKMRLPNSLASISTASSLSACRKTTGSWQPHVRVLLHAHVDAVDSPRGRELEPPVARR